MSGAVGDGAAAEPLALNPARVLAVERLHLHPVAFDVDGAKHDFVLETVGGGSLRGGTFAQGELLSAVVTAADGDARLVNPVAGSGTLQLLIAVVGQPVFAILDLPPAIDALHHHHHGVAVGGNLCRYLALRGIAFSLLSVVMAVL